MLAYLRDPANATKLGVDTRRMVLAGHSMGGWVVAHTAANDHGLSGAILISAADMGRLGAAPHDRVLAEMADDMESLADVTAESMAAEAIANAKAFQMQNDVAGLVQMPLLVLTANDGLKPDTDALVSAIQAKGGHKITTLHVATDHSWSDRRITLETEIIKWLNGLH